MKETQDVDGAKLPRPSPQLQSNVDQQNTAKGGETAQEPTPTQNNDAGEVVSLVSPIEDVPKPTKSSPAVLSGKASPGPHLTPQSDLGNDDVERLASMGIDDDSELRLFPHPRNIDGATSPQWTRKSGRRKASGDVSIDNHKMHKFSLYETQARYYLVGGDLNDENFRVLKIDRTAPPGQLGLVEDEVVYDKYQMNDLLTTIDQGNKKGGGMKLKGNAWGLIGFIRFTDSYYMLLITKKQQVAMVGGHYIYQVDDTQLVPLTTGPPAKSESNKNLQEQRYLSILHNLDLHRSFYFSYSYNVTQSLQTNTIQSRSDPEAVKNNKPYKTMNDMFVWNHHLLNPAVQVLKKPYDWCLPIIHGSIDQSSIDVFGRSIWVTLIARRSRFFAGARFLKRGANDLGYVANDVESEQIVADLDTTPFGAPRVRFSKVPNYTSFVQHRGSIPLYWTQDSTGVTPKPSIELNFIDPFYATAALHFDNLFERYGAPLTVLNLVKARERTPRESKLLVEYENAIAYLNQALPEDKRIVYRKFDMARAAKTRGQDVIGSLGTIAQDLLQRTGFFHNGTDEAMDPCVQNGVSRSNCIDCLDRTNACQFVIGKTALALQLQALGVIAGEHINYNSDASNILAHMYNDHGDTLASQYGGSHLVNTTDSYQKINNWQSHSRDMLESFKRYYHNSFLDSQRQEAYNLFLGNYRYVSSQPMLWELSTDYWLHHAAPNTYYELTRRNYIQWFTPRFLEPLAMPVLNRCVQHKNTTDSLYNTDWWHEYYKPDTLTSFSKSFAFRVNSSTKYLPKNAASPSLDKSPFVVRSNTQDDGTANRTSSQSESPKAGEPSNAITPLAATSPAQANAKRIASLTQWLEESATRAPTHLPASAEKSIEAVNQKPISARFKAADKSQMNQWAPEQFYDNSLNPAVPKDQHRVYEDYLSREVPPLPTLNTFTDILGQTYRNYVDKTDRIANETPGHGTLADIASYERYLIMPDEPLTIQDDDWDTKRYKVYDRWLRGRNLFKQGGKVARE